MTETLSLPFSAALDTPRPDVPAFQITSGQANVGIEGISKGASLLPIAFQSSIGVRGSSGGVPGVRSPASRATAKRIRGYWRPRRE